MSISKKLHKFFKMALKFSILIILIKIVFFKASSPATREGNWPVDMKTPFSYPTPSPIAINTGSVKLLTNLPVLSFANSINDKQIVTNTGTTVTVRLAQAGTKASITGGPFYNKTYFFHGIDFLWNNDYSQRCGTTFDGIGLPLEIVHAYVNQEYGSFQNALKHRDGIAVIVKGVRVAGLLDNPYFKPFQTILQKIKQPWSSVQTSASTIYNWYNLLANYTSYYSYPGSLLDLSKVDYQYQAGTVVVFQNNVLPHISIPQFEYFRNLIANSGIPLSNTVPIYLQDRRPVIQSFGIKEISIP